jgi:hypothetical protein
MEGELGVDHVLTAAYDALEKLLHEFQAALDGIPDEDLASWKPAAAHSGGGEMNTLAALAVHTASAGGWMLHHQVYGDDLPRDREAEFRAVAIRDEIDAIFEGWLESFRERIERGDAVDLAAMPPTIRETIPDWSRMHWLFHMIDHTALHLGHAQLHRQLREAERHGHPQ